MDKIMIHIHSEDYDKSIVFYKKIGFSVDSDELDGDGRRHVKLVHYLFQGMLFKLKYIPIFLDFFKEKATRDQLMPVLISIVVDNYMDWVEVVRKGLIEIELEIIEPWGVWYYFRDPSGNLLCITNEDFV